MLGKMSRRDKIALVLALYLACLAIVYYVAFEANLAGIKSRVIIFGGLGGAVLYVLYKNETEKELKAKQIKEVKTWNKKN